MKSCHSLFTCSRTVSLGALALLLADPITFAADPKPAPTPPHPQAVETPMQREREQSRRNLHLMEKELAQIQQEVRKRRDELDDLREHLQVSERENTGNPSDSTAWESIRIMETQALDSDLKRREMEALYQLLEKMSRNDLKRALPTVSPDAALTSLLQSEAAADQKLVTLVANHGDQHPEVRAARTLLDRIKEQIDERMDGIMLGMRIRAEAAQAALDRLRKELERAKQASVERSISLGPYFQAKRDLENRQQIRDRLQLRLYQEQIDAALLEAR